jgi:ApbE superfamily uncharacterized protein (UPF0280 family)
MKRVNGLYADTAAVQLGVRPIAHVAGTIGNYQDVASIDQATDHW